MTVRNVKYEIEGGKYKNASCIQNVQCTISLISGSSRRTLARFFSTGDSPEVTTRAPCTSSWATSRSNPLTAVKPICLTSPGNIDVL